MHFVTDMSADAQPAAPVGEQASNKCRWRAGSHEGPSTRQVNLLTLTSTNRALPTVTGCLLLRSVVWLMRKNSSTTTHMQLLDEYFAEERAAQGRASTPDPDPNEQFLRSFILNRGWVDQDESGYVPTYNEVCRLCALQLRHVQHYLE